MADEAEILNYDSDNEDAPQTTTAAAQQAAGSYAGAHSAGFRDFLLKSELSRAIVDCGFEHPSQVQQECIPQAILGGDVLGQAKSGMGKTAVFVIATLQQIKPETDGVATVLVMCHTRELAHQIHKEFERFSKFFEPKVKTAVIFGGEPISDHRNILKNDKPHIIVGTPGRIAALVKSGDLDLSGCKHFILDECDKMLDQTDMRKTVQEIFFKTPHQKQVMMFSATLNKDIQPVCKKFMENPQVILLDHDKKLTLDDLKQYYVKLSEQEKNRKLLDLLDSLEFNQVVIFLKSVSRCNLLAKVLAQQGFPADCIHSGMKQAQRLEKYTAFKNFKTRILCATDLFGRGMDIERVNIVINYDMPPETDTYLHRIARAGRFGTKGLAISFVSTDEDAAILNSVQERFEVSVPELPAELEKSDYMEVAQMTE